MANLDFDSDSGKDLSTDWVTDPPIRQLKAGEVKTCCDWLADAIDDWAVTDKSNGSPVPKEYDEIRALWNKRIGDGVARAAVIALADQSDKLDRDVYAYFYSGKPVGMMSIDADETGKRKAVYVEELVAHPGARNAGDLLVEHAVRLSDAAGFGGVVELLALAGAHDFYKSLGFERADSKSRWSGLVPARLTPSSPQWQKLLGKWTLTALWQVRSANPTLEAIPTEAFRN